MSSHYKILIKALLSQDVASHLLSAMSKLAMYERVCMCVNFLMCSEKKTCLLKRVLHDKNRLIGLGTILLDVFI